MVENDKPVALPVADGHRVTLAMAPFGVKTIRIVARPPQPAPVVFSLRAHAVSDMQVRLSWDSDAASSGHFSVYRGATADFAPSLLHLVGRPVDRTYTDQPTLYCGGWINNRIEPTTTYFYRVAAVDRWNHEGPLSAPVRVTTLPSSTTNMVPVRVECLRAVLVSPLARHNFVNLLFRTNCESDVRRYEVHRSTQPGFRPESSTRVGLVDADALVPGSGAYGHVPTDHRMGDYDHMMFQDHAVEPAATYFYRVRAVDTAGQTGPFSNEAMVRTKPPSRPVCATSASSEYATWYCADNAIDGVPYYESAWISLPYGGGTQESSSDAWWAVDFPRRVVLGGVDVVGDDRDCIPVQRGLRIEYRGDGAWETAAEVRDATGRTILARWPTPIETDALRIYVPAADLPRATVPEIPDGVVRVCELTLVLPDGRSVTVPELFGR